MMGKCTSRLGVKKWRCNDPKIIWFLVILELRSGLTPTDVEGDCTAEMFLLVLVRACHLEKWLWVSDGGRGGVTGQWWALPVRWMWWNSKRWIWEVVIKDEGLFWNLQHNYYNNLQGFNIRDWTRAQSDVRKKKKRLRWFLLLSTMLDPRTILRDNMTSFTANLLF